MRKLFFAVATCAVLAVAGGGAAATASADSGSGDIQTLPQPRPAWLTDSLEAKILAAGSKGVEVRFDKGTALEPNCLGTAPPYAGTDGVSASAVAAGTCVVSPAGCTMNFIFT